MANSNSSLSAKPAAVPPGALGLLSSSVGLKVVMAVTGFILVGFVIIHFLGNALVFAGPEAINAYSRMLHDSGGLLWLARAVLLLSVGLHIWAAVRLTARNNAARPQRYRVQQDAATNYAARTMIWSGFIVAAFLIYHLAHLTFGVTPGAYAHDPADVYSNVVQGFSVPWVTGFYVIAQVALGHHLFHGVWSMLQSLGIHHPAYNERLRSLAVGIAFLITAGNISIPLAVLAGLVG